jgi:hypothetical protein
MVSEAEFDRVQTLLGRDGIPRAKFLHEFAFTGLIRCGECNQMVTAEEKHQLMCSQCKFKFAYRRRTTCPRCEVPIKKMVNPLFLHYTYYHCTKRRKPPCSQQAISGIELEKQIGEYIERIHISEEFKQYCLKFLRGIHSHETAAQTATIEMQQKAYRECVQEIDNLVKLKISPSNADGSRLSEEEYGQRRFKLLKDKARFEELFQDAGLRIEQQLKLSHG